LVFRQSMNQLLHTSSGPATLKIKVASGAKPEVAIGSGHTGILLEDGGLGKRKKNPEFHQFQGAATWFVVRATLVE
jgi:hypothetical protein